MPPAVKCSNFAEVLRRSASGGQLRLADRITVVDLVQENQIQEFFCEASTSIFDTGMADWLLYCDAWAGELFLQHAALKKSQLGSQWIL